MKTRNQILTEALTQLASSFNPIPGMVQATAATALASSKEAPDLFHELAEVVGMDFEGKVVTIRCKTPEDAQDLHSTLLWRTPKGLELSRFNALQAVQDNWRAMNDAITAAGKLGLLIEPGVDWRGNDITISAVKQFVKD